MEDRGGYFLFSNNYFKFLRYCFFMSYIIANIGKKTIAASDFQIAIEKLSENSARPLGSRGARSLKKLLFQTDPILIRSSLFKS